MANLRKRLQANKTFSAPGNHVKPPKAKDDEGPRLGPWVIGLFIFIVLGSALVEVLRVLDNQRQPLVPNQANGQRMRVVPNEDIGLDGDDMNLN